MHHEYGTAAKGPFGSEVDARKAAEDLVAFKTPLWLGPAPYCDLPHIIPVARIHYITIKEE